MKLLEAGVDLNYRSKYKSIITFNTLLKLYQTYFRHLSFIANEEIKVSKEDKDIVIFLLRVHFRQWIELDGFNITVYKDFPQKFEVIKEVNKYKHYFTPRTFVEGEVLELLFLELLQEIVIIDRNTTPYFIKNLICFFL